MRQGIKKSFHKVDFLMKSALRIIYEMLLKNFANWFHHIDHQSPSRLEQIKQMAPE
jgi:hypothetical protein